MNYKLRKNGFSLVEVLMASAILAVGLLMVAGTFPAGIFLTAASVEQTIAPIAADEAFAKIQLYGIRFSGADSLPANTNTCVDFNNINTVKGAGVNIDQNEYRYPSINTLTDRVYNWSAICRRVNPNLDNRLVQVTVFVSRKMGQWVKYPHPLGGPNVDWPTPVIVGIKNAGGRKFEISTAAQFSFVNANSTVVFDQSGNIYRVLSREKNVTTPDYDTVIIDRDWAELSAAGQVWVVPPPTTGGRSPCIGVYQRIIKF
jgi:prepilin-type N-terminal cleavage/methylation domain-containing protein